MCAGCAETEIPIIRRHAAAMGEALAQFTDAQGEVAKLAYLSRAAEACDSLTYYEGIGVSTITPPPSAMLRKLEAREVDLVNAALGEIRRQWAQSMEASPEPTAQLAAYSDALAAMDELMDAARDVSKVEKAAVQFAGKRDRLARRVDRGDS